MQIYNSGGLYNSGAVYGGLGEIGRTLTYHLNRLAGTLISDIPQYAAQGAAQIWAKNNSVTPYNGIALAGVLNNIYASRNSGKNYHYDIQGALNALAGTTGLGTDEAASEIIT
jgi:hypothetical protein